MSSLAIAEQFVACINAHDVDGLARLATSDHRFIDSLGAVLEGRDAIRSAWQAYFELVPDYHLAIGQRFSAEAEVVLLAVAGGSLSPGGHPREDSAWTTPAALRALIRGDRVAEWQVYADNEPIRQQMRRVSV
jgi:uncharacterized protein (TIGR02246 family)